VVCASADGECELALPGKIHWTISSTHLSAIIDAITVACFQSSVIPIPEE
jgi:hypothetical protein